MLEGLVFLHNRDAPVIHGDLRGVGLQVFLAKPISIILQLDTVTYLDI